MEITAREYVMLLRIILFMDEIVEGVIDNL
ncbi:DUF4020 domain-containing protein [Bacillus pacificus]